MSLSEQLFNHQQYKDCDIIKKCVKYPEFRKQFQKLEDQYENQLNMALYASLQFVEDCQVIEIIQKDKLFVNFFAYRMLPDESESEKFYMLWIRLLDQILRLNFGKKYTLIYYNCLNESSFPYTFLKGIYKKLPLFYHAMLEKVYVVESTFLLRNVGLFDFGRVHKLLMRKVEYIDTLYLLSKVSQIQKNGIIEKLPQELKMQVNLKSQKHQKSQKTDLIKKKIQQQHLSRQSSITAYHSIIKKDFFTIDLNAHKLGPDGIPLPLTILFEALKANPKYLSMEGIFRKSGSIEEEQAIIAQMSQMAAVGPLKNIDQFSGFAIAGVVKKFFTKLTIPIVPYPLYISLMEAISKNVIRSQEEVSFVKGFLNQLPIINRKVIIHLVMFLREHTISKQELNKMNNYNMSVCFCPCIFRAETPSLQDLLYSGKFAGIINILLNRFEEIADNEEKGSRNSKGNRKS